MVPIAAAPGTKVGVKVATEFERLLQKSSLNDFQRLIRKGYKPQFKIVKVARGAPLVLGAAVLIGTVALNSITAQTAALETLTGVVELIDKLRDTEDCEGCIKRAVWSQAKKQKRVRTTSRRRGGNEDNLPTKPIFVG